MRISFIVLTYNRADALLAVLRALAVQCGPTHEVLIADDGSRSDQVAEVLQHCPDFLCPVRHIWHPDIGFTAAGARNLGAHFSSGDYLVFLDGDCIPHRSFVIQHTHLAKQGFFVNGSRVMLSKSLTQRVLAKQLDLPRSSFFFWLQARVKGDCNKLFHLARWPFSLFRVQEKFNWRGIRSCNFAVWRHDFFAINGFDETFTGWGHEDADLVLRLDHLGVRRKNGFMATEVFHLWHPHSERDQELANRNRVMDRSKTNVVRAEKGLLELDAVSSVKISIPNQIKNHAHHTIPKPPKLH